MVRFLEFILENPQTNSAHAFAQFQDGKLGPHPHSDKTGLVPEIHTRF